MMKKRSSAACATCPTETIRNSTKSASSVAGSNPSSSWLWRNYASRFFCLALFWMLFIFHEYAIVLRTESQPGPDSLMALWSSSSVQNTGSRISGDSATETFARKRKTLIEIIRERPKQPEKRAEATAAAAAAVINRTLPANQTRFNGIPVTYHDGITPHSSVQCIHDHPLAPGQHRSYQHSHNSDNYHHQDHSHNNTDWMYRSCRYENLCLDMSTHEYVVFTHQKSPSAVALGGINPRWEGSGPHQGIGKIRWEPIHRVDSNHPGSSDGVKSSTTPVGYYSLPDDYILIPFHSFAAHNVGHLLWDDFYPIFSLLRIFGLLDNSMTKKPFLLPLRHKIAESLYANCDIRYNKRQSCARNFERFWPLMGVDPAHFSVTHKAVLTLPNPHDNARSPYVCARTAVAGLGMLTDHGWEDHGWNGQGHRPHNLARGPNFWAFGEFLVRNVLGEQPPVAYFDSMPPPPVQVVFSTRSSRDSDRRLDFAAQLAFLRQHMPANLLQVEDYNLWEYSLEEQIRLAQATHIFVTACGGGAMTATFLPPGSVLIIFYNPAGGLAFGPHANNENDTNLTLTGRPARLDWDLLNNAGHLRVHWLPVTTMNTPADLILLGLLLQHEAQTIIERYAT